MITTQVLIVGAGPAGMVCALSLAQAGIRCVLVDKRLERLAAPKAHAVNPRTLEICERLGVRVLVEGAPVETVNPVGNTALEPYVIDLQKHAGKQAVIEVFDNSPDPGHHVSVDDFRYTQLIPSRANRLLQ